MSLCLISFPEHSAAVLEIVYLPLVLDLEVCVLFSIIRRVDFIRFPFFNEQRPDSHHEEVFLCVYLRGFGIQ